MDQGTTLAELLALNLHECEDDVKMIVDKAVKEMSMEKMLRELQTTWAAMEFYRETHFRTGCSLLRASEKLIETLEENQVGFFFQRIVFGILQQKTYRFCRDAFIYYYIFFLGINRKYRKSSASIFTKIN